MSEFRLLSTRLVSQDWLKLNSSAALAMSEEKTTITSSLEGCKMVDSSLSQMVAEVPTGNGSVVGQGAFSVTTGQAAAALYSWCRTVELV